MLLWSLPHQFSLSRRSFVTSGLAVAAAARLQRAAAQSFRSSEQAGVCRLSPEQEVGPYYIPDELFRSDIVEGKPGVPLTLRLAVMNARTCEPLPNVAVDIWHCDALGLYSGFTKMSPMGPGGPGGPGGRPPGPPPGFDPQHPGNRPGPPEGMERMGPPPQNHPTDKLTFLRGIQLTDAEGFVVFQTVFPGFYMGRTNHIHFKVRTGGHREGKSYASDHTSHIGQVFFPEEFSARLMEHEPYSKHRIHRTTQAEDGIYGDQQGALSVARLDPVHTQDLAAGLHAELIAAVDPAATPAPARRAF